jgi:hypothetical protein
LGFVVGDDDLLELDFELSVLELVDVAVLVSEPQPDNTTARAVMAAATPASAEALICLLLVIGILVVAAADKTSPSVVPDRSVAQNCLFAE